MLDIFKEVGEELQEAFSMVGQPATKITVAKPFCTPCRLYITKTLPKYGVKILKWREEVKYVRAKDFLKHMKVGWRQGENLEKYGLAGTMFLPLAHVADVWVKPQQAVWAEYLLLRTGQLYRVGKYLDQRNQAWAERHNGVLPPTWDRKPWIEKGCSEGVSQWKPVEKFVKAQEPPPKKRWV